MDAPFEKPFKPGTAAAFPQRTTKQGLACYLALYLPASAPSLRHCECFSSKLGSTSATAAAAAAVACLRTPLCCGASSPVRPPSGLFVAVLLLRLVRFLRGPSQPKVFVLSAARSRSRVVKRSRRGLMQRRVGFVGVYERIRCPVCRTPALVLCTAKQALQIEFKPDRSAQHDPMLPRSDTKLSDVDDRNLQSISCVCSTAFNL